MMWWESHGKWREGPGVVLKHSDFQNSSLLVEILSTHTSGTVDDSRVLFRLPWRTVMWVLSEKYSELPP